VVHLPGQVRGACRFFAFLLANGTLALDLTGEVDLREPLTEPSWVEMAFAIFINVLDVDADGMVTNDNAAYRRAAQYLRACLGHDYEVHPPLAEWEIELPL
jgi:hypothetical protein